MSYVAGAIAGIAGGLACILVIGGIPGVVAGAVVAALLYVGVGKLLTPELRLGDVAAGLVPNGEEAAARVAEARKLAGRVRKLGARAASEDVRGEAEQLAADLECLTSYVERQPATYRRLTHYLSTYGEQCSSVLENYLLIEGAGTAAPVRAGGAARGGSSRGGFPARDDSAAQAHADVIEALNALEGAAQGELKRAMGAKVAELSADSDAVRRLMEMDGYTADERSSAGAGFAGGSSAGHAGSADGPLAGHARTTDGSLVGHAGTTGAAAGKEGNDAHVQG